MKLLAILVTVVATLVQGLTSSLLSEDPSKFPGHLLPIGEEREKLHIETVKEFPPPQEFFKKYVNGSKPLLIKGAAKDSPAYSLWNDDYLLNDPEADKATVYTEPELKENRTKEGKSISFKEFLTIYQKDGIYLVDDLPAHLGRDTLMPVPLRCDDTEELLALKMAWFSAGGTRSVLHQDYADNINCLFRGTKRLLLIDTEKQKYKIPIEMYWMKYSDVDVDRVDYEKYPTLRDLDEFYVADMEEGDCLFIPFKWTHQVNSRRNEDTKQSIAVNVWFSHEPNHVPCADGKGPQRKFINDFTFTGNEVLESTAIIREVDNLFKSVANYHVDAREPLTIVKFLRLLYTIHGYTEFHNKDVIKHKSFLKVAKQLYRLIDTDSDKSLQMNDLFQIQFIENGLKQIVELFEDLSKVAVKLAKQIGTDHESESNSEHMSNHDKNTNGNAKTNVDEKLNSQPEENSSENSQEKHTVPKEEL